MWFWHASFGYAGTLNDRTILELSPFLESMVNGDLANREQKVVPFKIAGEEFNQMYVLADGIYPQWSRFAKSFKQPSSRAEKRYSEWQESARKDIERAFGNLQGKFQYMDRPIDENDLHKIGARVTTCLLLHNMCRSDYVMGDVYARYDPAYSVRKEDIVAIVNPSDLRQKQGVTRAKDRTAVGMKHCNGNEVLNLTRRHRWNQLLNPVEHARLHLALMNHQVAVHNSL